MIPELVFTISGIPNRDEIPEDLQTLIRALDEFRLREP